MSDPIITRLDLIEQLARKRRRSDIQFRTWVKAGSMSDSELDAVVKETAGEVAARIDCTTCANCCRTMQVVVDDLDIRRLARSLSLPAAEFERRYVLRAKDGVKHFATSPCPMLEGSRCSVYEDRPKSCRDFPYLQTERFRSRMLMMVDNTSICPIVFNTYDRLKKRLGFHQPASQAPFSLREKGRG